MWQRTAIVGKWQICTSTLMQLYKFYSDNVIIYMMIRETIQYNMHIKIGSVLYTLNVNKACKYMCKCICMAFFRLRAN